MTIGIFGDVHFDRENCFREKFLQAFLLVAPLVDVVIFNGDFCDRTTEASRGHFRRFYKLAEKEAVTMKLFFVLSSLRHDALLLEFPELAVGHYAELASATGKILCVHGNRIGLDPVLAKQQPKLATIQAKARLIAKQQKQPQQLFSPSLVRSPLFLPPISWEHHLVIGHLHRRFYDDKARVYNPGCWVPTSNPYDNCNLMLINDQNKDHPEPQILSLLELVGAVQTLQGV